MAAALLALAALSAPTLAATYPVSGRWGQSTGDTKGTIDCQSRRVISFNGNQRTDTDGGVPALRNVSVMADGLSQYRVVDEFSNGQISSGYTTYTLRLIDSDHIELQFHPGGSLTLQRCK